MEERTKNKNNVSRDSDPNLLSGDDMIEFSEAKMEYMIEFNEAKMEFEEKRRYTYDEKAKKNAEPEAIMKID
jgi:hypothetical protein